MAEYDVVKREIEALIRKYNQRKSEVGERGLGELSEANVRKDFIEPLFRALDWKTDDSREYDAENYVRGAGHADVALKIDSKPVIFIEAKRFGGVPSRLERGVQLTLTGQKIYADWTEEERQVLNYAGMSVNVKWAILTNFVKFRLFNAKTGDTVLDIESPAQYFERLDDLMLLTKNQVAIGNINKLETRIERPDVDLDFLNLLNDWRLKLARAIHKSCPELDLDKIKQYVQRILNRLVIIRYAEDKWVLENPDMLKAVYDYWLKTQTYNRLTGVLKQLFVGFEQIHDSKIFEKDEELDKILDRTDSNVLGEIIEQLYRQSFRKFTSDILGNTYENYLGHELYFKNGQIDLRENPKLQQAGGITYTPPFIVNFIVNHTVRLRFEEAFLEIEKLFSEEKYDEAALKFKALSLQILDPACGSGSFLIKAYDVIKEYFLKYNLLIANANQQIFAKVAKLRREGKRKEAWELQELEHLQNFEKQILRQMLFGVDLDPQAAELTSVNLMLQGLKRGEKLPLILYENVKVGNSIIDMTPNELSRQFGDKITEKQPFKWESEFKDVLGEGFSIVIGNPPYNNMRDKELRNEQIFCEKYYPEVYRGNADILYYFVTKGLQLLELGGLLCFIVARYFMKSTEADKFRDHLLKNTKIKCIVDTQNFQCFRKRNVLTCIIVLEKIQPSPQPVNNTIKVMNVKKWSNDGTKLFEHITNHLSQDRYSDDFIEVFWKNQNQLSSEPWTFQSGDIGGILDKVRSDSWSLNEICEVGVGFETGLNAARTDTDVENPKAEKHGVFVMSNQEARNLQLEEKALVKIVEPNEIQRYHINYNGSFLLNTSRDTNIDSIPNIKGHLSRFRKQLERRNAMPHCKWFGISHRKNEELFEKSPRKIMVPAYATGNRFAIDNGKKYYCINTAYIIVPKHNFQIDLIYVLAILNSKLIEFYHKKELSKLKREGYYEYFAKQLRRIPIHKIDLEDQSQKAIYDQLCSLAPKMIDLIQRRASIITDFERHLTEPIISSSKLRNYYDQIPVFEKQILDPRGKGQIRRVRVEVDGEWLTFLIDAKPKTGEELRDHPIFRCKISEYALRIFIANYLLSQKKIGSGNFMEKILQIEIPLFHRELAENRGLLEKQMQKFIETIDQAQKLDDILKRTDDEINSLVYRLYGLDHDEKAAVEAFFSNII